MKEIIDYNALIKLYPYRDHVSYKARTINMIWGKEQFLKGLKVPFGIVEVDITSHKIFLDFLEAENYGKKEIKDGFYTSNDGQAFEEIKEVLLIDLEFKKWLIKHRGRFTKDGIKIINEDYELVWNNLIRSRKLWVNWQDTIWNSRRRYYET